MAGRGSAGHGMAWQGQLNNNRISTSKCQCQSGTQGTQGRKRREMKITVELIGTSPLLQHNVQLADPDNKWVKEIATYTAKRKKTEDDRKAISRLEWYGGLYVEDGAPVVPTRWLRKCFIQAGKISKLGTAIARGLAFADLNVPLVYEGPVDLDAMYADPEFVNVAAIGISGTKKTMRTRPQFPKWAVVADAMLMEDVLDFDTFVSVVEAGRTH